MRRHRKPKPPPERGAWRYCITRVGSMWEIRCQPPWQTGYHTAMGADLRRLKRWVATMLRRRGKDRPPPPVPGKEVYAVPDEETPTATD